MQNIFVLFDGKVFEDKVVEVILGHKRVDVTGI